MSYREQLKQFFAKTFKGWYIEVTRPKKFLLECGIPDLPIVIKPDTLKRKIEQHNLTKQDIACLNTSINSPLLVYDTTKEHLRGVAYNVIIWKNKEEDSLLCCTIYVNQEINIAVNNIASIHPRDIEQLTNWNHNGLLKKMCDIDKIKKVVIGSRFNCTKCNNFLLSLLDTAKVKKDSEKPNNDAKKLNGLDVSNIQLGDVVGFRNGFKSDEMIDYGVVCKISREHNFLEVGYVDLRKKNPLSVRLDLLNGWFVESDRFHANKPKAKVGDVHDHFVVKDVYGAVCGKKGNFVSMTWMYKIHDTKQNEDMLYDEDAITQLLNDKADDDELEMLELEAEALALELELGSDSVNGN